MIGKKGEFNLQGMLFGLLGIGLFMGMIGLIIESTGYNYDTEGYSASDIERYQIVPNMTRDVESVATDVEAVTVDRSAFDILADVWNKVTTPFKFTYRSFTTATGLAGDVSEQFLLPKIFADYIVTALTILVIIGIVLIKFYLGKKK